MPAAPTPAPTPPHAQLQALGLSPLSPHPEQGYENLEQDPNVIILTHQRWAIQVTIERETVKRRPTDESACYAYLQVLLGPWAYTFQGYFTNFSPQVRLLSATGEGRESVVVDFALFRRYDDTLPVILEAKAQKSAAAISDPEDLEKETSEITRSAVGQACSQALCVFAAYPNMEHTFALLVTPVAFTLLGYDRPASAEEDTGADSEEDAGAAEDNTGTEEDADAQEDSDAEGDSNAEGDSDAECPGDSDAEEAHTSTEEDTAAGTSAASADSAEEISGAPFGEHYYQNAIRQLKEHIAEAVAEALKPKVLYYCQPWIRDDGDTLYPSHPLTKALEMIKQSNPAGIAELANALIGTQKSWYDVTNEVLAQADPRLLELGEIEIERGFMSTITKLRETLDVLTEDDDIPQDLVYELMRDSLDGDYKPHNKKVKDAAAMVRDRIFTRSQARAAHSGSVHRDGSSGLMQTLSPLRAPPLPSHGPGPSSPTSPTPKRQRRGDHDVLVSYSHPSRG
ncbi:hypothetical protein OH77DRAFT_928390 [Trametes cingulata]|nr:hypothetical protein OH77DRAFT_928390 [Trametes cingulata]